MNDRGTTTGPIYQQLGRLKQEHRGRVLEIEQRAGLGAGGKIARVIRGERSIHLETLEAILDAAAEPPKRFFGRAFDLVPKPPPEPLAVGSGRWLLDLLQLGDTEPPSIQRLRRVANNLPPSNPTNPPPPASPAVSQFTREKLRAELATGSLAQRREILRHPLCQSADFVRLAAEALDDLRYAKPEDAAALAFDLAVTVCPELPGAQARDAFTTATGVFASSHRLKGSIETAARALALVAGKAPLALQGDLFQRIPTLLIHCAHYQEALEVSTAAMQVYLAEANFPRIGQVLIDRGAALVLSGSYEQAQSSFEAGAALLAPEDERHRIAALQGFAQVALFGGQPEKALLLLEEAQPLVRDPYTVGIMIWFRGAIQRELGASAEAENYLRQAQDMLWPLNVFDWSLATLDLLEVLLARGSLVEAHQAANDVGRLLEPHKSNRIAAAALQQLVDVRQTAEGLTQAAVEAARAVLHQGRQLGLPAIGARPG